MSQPNDKPTGWRKWLSLAVICLALAISVIDGTVLNVSITNIIKDLNTDIQSIQWVITSYSLVLAALTITGGRLSDIFGRKRMFILGAIIFGIGSLITSLAPNVNILLLGWSVIEGIGAALMIPATSALIVSNFEGADRNRAFAMFGATAGAASAIGPILGGYLTTYFSWNWAFRINLFVVVILLLGSRYIRDFVTDVKKVSLDWLGVVLSSLGMAAVTYGIIESSTYGWFTAKKAFELAGQTYDLAGISISTYMLGFGILALVLFVLWELRVEKRGGAPIVSMTLFRNRPFTVGIMTTTILFAGFTGIITYGIALFFQSVLKLNALDSGVGLLPLSIGTLIMAPVSAILAHRFGAKIVVQTGVFLSIVATLVLYFTLSVDATRVTLIPGLALFGLAFGLIVSQISNITLSAVRRDQAGEASGVNGTIREVGRTLGSALIGAIFLSTLTTSLTDRVNTNTVIPVQAKPAIIQQVNDGGSELEFGSNNSQANSNTPQAVTDEVATIVKASVTEGNREALLYTVIFLVVCFAVSFGLPSSKQFEEDQKAVESVDATGKLLVDSE